MALRPEGGQQGTLADSDLNEVNLPQLLAINSFRPDLPKAMSIEDIWPLLLLFAAVVFLGDVFVRRVAVTSDWILPAVYWVAQRLRPAGADEPADARLDRLRSRKAELVRSIDQRRAATRFEPQMADDSADQTPRDLDAVLQDAASAAPDAKTPQKKPPASTIDQSESDSYTKRLLEAKRKARKEQDKKHKRN